jgi:hypothetical protein
MFSTVFVQLLFEHVCEQNGLSTYELSTRTRFHILHKLLSNRSAAAHCNGHSVAAVIVQCQR